MKDENAEYVLEKIYRMGIVPVVTIEKASDAENVAKSLMNGGIFCAEITFRTSAAAESIKIIHEKFPRMCVGAGTILTLEQVDEALEAGAQFLVSPGFNPKVVRYAIEKNALFLPGVSTPSEIEAAMEMGLDTVKFFPAEQSGGIEKIKAMSAPYTKVRFMPTGGINKENLNTYLKFSQIVACGGSWMIAPKMIKDGNWEEVTRLSREAVQSIQGFEIHEVGIYSDDLCEAQKKAELIASIFGWKLNNDAGSVLIQKALRLCHREKNNMIGYIKVTTNHLERAMEYMKSVAGEMGISKKQEANKNILVLEETFFGFKILIEER